MSLPPNPNTLSNLVGLAHEALGPIGAALPEDTAVLPAGHATTETIDWALRYEIDVAPYRHLVFLPGVQVEKGEGIN